MINCETHDHHHGHTNAFIDMNGVPYLLAEYVDKRNFQQIDRLFVRSEINIDQSESMRAIVDISVDDIGRNASDGLLAVIGNSTKQKNLMDMITASAQRYNHQLNVLRGGIVLRVNYQLENQTTKQTIRSMCEDLRITDRSYFLDINSKDINDNAIIVNFSNSMVSTVNQFTHGIDRMILRVTSVQMFYECVEISPIMPRIKQSMTNSYPRDFLPTTYGSEQDLHRYHDQMQNRHLLGSHEDPYYYETPDAINPPTWTGFNRFYHFDNNGADIVLHRQEIDDTMCKSVLLAAGTIQVNRTFVINPGHRIIFKFSIWKNDATIVNDTTAIAEALDAFIYQGHHGHHHNHTDDTNCHCDCNGYPHDSINPDYETMNRLYRELQFTNDRQNAVINGLMTKIDTLTDQISGLLPPVTPEEPEDPPVVTPDPPVDPDPEEPETPPVAD